MCHMMGLHASARCLGITPLHAQARCYDPSGIRVPRAFQSTSPVCLNGDFQFKWLKEDFVVRSMPSHCGPRPRGWGFAATHPFRVQGFAPTHSFYRVRGFRSHSLLPSRVQGFAPTHCFRSHSPVLGLRVSHPPTSSRGLGFRTRPLLVGFKVWHPLIDLIQSSACGLRRAACGHRKKSLYPACKELWRPSRPTTTAGVSVSPTPPERSRNRRLMLRM